MLNTVLEKISQVFAYINPLFLFLLVILVGLFVFWRGSMETHKDRSSVFDMFLVSIVFGFLVGRIVFIVMNWNDFSDYIWYWLPYEKYGEEIYWFRLLPWRFFNISDGGLDILGMFSSFLLFASFWASFVKKWRWNHTFPTIYFTAIVMLGMSFLLTGFATQNTQWISQGGILLVFPLISLIFITITNKTIKPKLEKKLYVWVNVILVVLSCLCIQYIYLSGEVISVERIMSYILLAWTITGLILFLVDIKRANVSIESVSSVRTISPIDINQPIKLRR